MIILSYDSVAILAPGVVCIRVNVYGSFSERVAADPSVHSPSAVDYDGPSSGILDVIVD